jgi:hypothetical protein
MAESLQQPVFCRRMGAFAEAIGGLLYRLIPNQNRFFPDTHYASGDFMQQIQNGYGIA